ncbi:hypothetical protein PHYPSEUDO_004032 [Phytophthora pseudosyringae]|uniref:Uncharacterized protein n=1 Tax=Phytophthora pseudosyringae TaxID=221518 RepID=A0A8T1VS42_9STRA|nr:hypothetical protein PHYPSEUDO_004032 [Phytophthora pseudosyringae]
MVVHSYRLRSRTRGGDALHRQQAIESQLSLRMTTSALRGSRGRHMDSINQRLVLDKYKLPYSDYRSTPPLTVVVNTFNERTSRSFAPALMALAVPNIREALLKLATRIRRCNY